MQRKARLASLAVAGGADVNEEDEDGDTPLFYAAYSLHTDALNFLLEKGADPHKRNKSGMASALAVFTLTVTQILSFLR